jgi:hypothetical protein
MKSGALLIGAALVLLVARPSAAEDRIEKIPDSKGYKELVYRGDSLAEERSYDLKGALLEETSLGGDSLPEETRAYIREGGRLSRVEARDGSGAITGTRVYRYDRLGRLLGVDSDGSFGSGSAGMIATRALPSGSWVSGSQGGAKTKTTVLAYDDEGRATTLETLLDGTALSIENRSYGEGGILKTLHAEDKLSGLSSDLVYDEAGRVSVRTDIPAKGPKLRTEYRYDGSGRLIEERSFGQGRPFSKSYTYSDKGSLDRVETRRDGLLLLVVTYIENGRQEELYEDGSIFVRATYLGGRKVKDEFYADDLLVRTRNY